MTTISCNALLFDMDGVLIDSTPSVARIWTRWAVKHGMNPEYVIRFACGRPSLDSIRELLPELDHAVHLEEARWVEKTAIDDNADIVPLPGAAALLASVPSRQLAVVTSATRELTKVRLSATGLWAHVSNLVCAGDILRGKPDPEPYLKGAATLHMDPHDCIVIEDSPSGIRSGKAAGARVLALRTTTPQEDLISAGADWIIDDCASIRSLSRTLPGLSLELSETKPSKRR